MKSTLCSLIKVGSVEVTSIWPKFASITDIQSPSKALSLAELVLDARGQVLASRSRVCQDLRNQHLEVCKEGRDQVRGGDSCEAG